MLLGFHGFLLCSRRKRSGGNTRKTQKARSCARITYPRSEMVQQQFLAEAERGAMAEMSLESAKATFGRDLAVASLDAIEKKDGSYRGVGVNARIKVRDQIRSPSAGDVQALLRELPGVFFGLTGDVKRAHRLVKIAMRDWGAQACRTGVLNADRVWVNKVGTFGISSAAYHWARLMAGLGRSVYYLLGRAELALLIYVDDLLWLIRDKQALELIPLVISYLVVLGLPFAWKKFGGVSVLSWVGFEICLQSAKIGLSEQRARWLCRWLDDSVSTGWARIADVSAVLGRLSFGLTALGHFRPFLRPVYAWVASMDTGRVYLLPKAIILIFKFLAKALQGEGRLVSVSRHVTTPKELFRTDARAEGEEIWIGGWALDDADTRRCRWFSERLSHSNAPWLYAAGEAYRQIAALELVATLAAVVVFGIPKGTTGTFRCSAATDNQGNSRVVARLLTTKFPLNAFLMELAAQLQCRGAELDLYWLPRLQNIEADELTNSICHRFAEGNRLRFQLAEFKGLVLGSMLEEGMSLYQDIATCRAAKKARQSSKLPKSQALHARDPWQ